MKKKYRKLERIALKLGESQGRSFFDKVIFKLKSERWIGANEVFREEKHTGQEGRMGYVRRGCKKYLLIYGERSRSQV